MRLEEQLVTSIFGASGYMHVQDFVGAVDLARLRNAIESQYFGILQESAPSFLQEFKDAGMERYHQHSAKVDHKKMWPKLVRILPETDVGMIRSMEFFRVLEDIFGPLAISTEEKVGWEEIYWRIVRPESVEDVGPLHADRWFWELGYGTMPANCTRIKLWFPIYSEPNRNGLLMVPGSHFEEWPYVSEVRDGMAKPLIVTTDREPKPVLIPAQPGDVLIFNDDLLHGGAVNRGDKTRVSLEFTIFVKTDRLQDLKKTFLGSVRTAKETTMQVL